MRGKCRTARRENARFCKKEEYSASCEVALGTALSQAAETLYLARVYQMPTMCQDRQPGSTACQLCGLEQFSILHLPYLCNCDSLLQGGFMRITDIICPISNSIRYREGNQCVLLSSD